MSTTAPRQSPVARAVKSALYGHAGFCSRVGCDQIAGWRVRVRVWASATPAPLRTYQNCAELRFPLSVCDGCKEQITVTDLVGDEGWARIVDAVGARCAPARDSLELAFEPINAGHA